MTNYKVAYANDDGREKVVHVLVEVEGTDGPATEHREFYWSFDERFKVSESGKYLPKTGQDYKAEIEAELDAEFNPKETSPSQYDRTYC